MSEEFSNVYDDRQRADAYDKLEYPGTYYLAFRDVPGLLKKYVKGRSALDFGCGAGRSTRFLQKEGFSPVVGIDISEHMVAYARERDPQGEYRIVPDGDLSGLPTGAFDLILAAFTFDNIPTGEKKIRIFSGLRRLLSPNGRIVSIVSAPEIYLHEWASFSTVAFPENKFAKSGDTVKIIMLDVDDKRPVEDILWTHESYLDVFRQAGLTVLEAHKPLALESEPYKWVSETSIAPWTIYVLSSAQ